MIDVDAPDAPTWRDVADIPKERIDERIRQYQEARSNPYYRYSSENQSNQD